MTGRPAAAHWSTPVIFSDYLACASQVPSLFRLRKENAVSLRGLGQVRSPEGDQGGIRQ